MSDPLVEALRALLVRCAPDPELAAPALSCAPDAPLNEIIPFSSLIILGFVVAVEDQFGVRVDHRTLLRVTEGAPTLRRLADTIRALREGAS